MGRMKKALCEPMLCCMFDQGMKAQEIADTFGVSCATVRDRLRKHGRKYTSHVTRKSCCPCVVACMRLCNMTMQSITYELGLTSLNPVWRICAELKMCEKVNCSREETYPERNAKIRELDEQGVPRREIDRMLGLARGTSSEMLCRKGVVKGDNNEQRHEKAKSFISDKVIDYFDGFEVVERTSKDTYSVRCGECGNEFRRCFDRKRKGAVTCPECEKARREAEWWAKPKRQMQIIFPAQPKKSTDPDEIIECVECGKRFRLGDTSFKQGRKPVCCSDRCKARRRNRFKHKDEKVTIFWRKVARHYGTMICYLCGIECDENDFTIVNGRKTIGDTYPTTDHVVPWFVSHDGSMENSRIACHRCNTMKHTMSLDEFCEMYGLEVSA